MTATVTKDAQEQVLGIVRKSQEMTLDAIKQVVETMNTAAAKLPAVPWPVATHYPVPRRRACWLGSRRVSSCWLCRLMTRRALVASGVRSTKSWKRQNISG